MEERIYMSGTCSFLIGVLLFVAIPVGAVLPALRAGQKSAPCACELLSQTDIERAIATVVNTAERRLAVESASDCRFTLRGGGMISVLVRRPARPGWSTEQVARMTSSPQRFHEIAGIGDRAFVFDMTEKGSALCVFRGDYYVQVSAFGIANPATFPPALAALARKPLTRF
jgi:hypothetical protein